MSEANPKTLTHAVGQSAIVSQLALEIEHTSEPDMAHLHMWRERAEMVWSECYSLELVAGQVGLLAEWTTMVAKLKMLTLALIPQPFGTTEITQGLQALALEVVAAAKAFRQAAYNSAG